MRRIGVLLPATADDLRFQTLVGARCARLLRRPRRSIAEVASGASEFPRTFDQPPLPFRLFLRRSGRVRPPVNFSPRQLGSLCRGFAACPPFRITP